MQGGAAIKITNNGGISPVESPDGRYLYYAKYEKGGIWRMPLQGGEEAEVLDEVSGGGWPNWGITSKGIYFLRFDKSPHATIRFFDFATTKVTPIWTFDKDRVGDSLFPQTKNPSFMCRMNLRNPTSCW